MVNLWNDPETRNAAAILAAAQNAEDPTRFTLWRELVASWSTSIGFDEDGNSWIDSASVERDAERVIEIAADPLIANWDAPQWYAYLAHNSMGDGNSAEAQAALSTFIDMQNNAIEKSNGTNGTAYLSLARGLGARGDQAGADAAIQAAVDIGHPPAVQKYHWSKFSDYRRAGQEDSAAAQDSLNRAIDAGSTFALNYRDWNDYAALKANNQQQSEAAKNLLAGLVGRNSTLAIQEQKQLNQEAS